MTDVHDFRAAYNAIQARIAKACEQSGRERATVHLTAISKFQPISALLKVIQAGQTTFGENRVQEAELKFDALRAKDLRLHLHLVGGLQTNKARTACRIADVIETLDRPALVEAILRAADQDGKLPKLYIQVNTGDEPQKYGVARSEADAFITLCLKRFPQHLTGLMAIPPLGADPAPHFKFLAQLAARYDLSDLSMGMSNDFETAIACGATHIRIGTAIFGHRSTPTRPHHQT